MDKLILASTNLGFDYNTFVDTLKAVLTFGVAIVILVIIIKIYKSVEIYNIDKSMKKPKPIEEEVINEDKLKITSKELGIKLKKDKPDFNVFKFYQEAFRTFSKVQKSWMNFDYAILKQLLTNELYNSYRIQLDGMKERNEKNIIRDIVLREAYMLDYIITPSEFTIKTVLKITSIDYIVNGKDEVIKGTRDKVFLRMYAINYTYKDNKWVISKKRTLHPFK